MKAAEPETMMQSGVWSQRLRRYADIAGGGKAPFGYNLRDWTVLGVVVYMGALLVQFSLGMGVNLFVSVPLHHPGAGASNVAVGLIQSLVWAIAQGPLLLVIHAILGVVVQVHPIFVARALPRLVPSTRWPTAVAPFCVLLAALSGMAYVAYRQDMFSLVMALGFGGAMLCYIITLYLVSRTDGRSEALASTP